MVCCCIRFRIPRTKQEIEADYQRKQITKKFREKLQQIKNSEMDDMDLQKGNYCKNIPWFSMYMRRWNLCPSLLSCHPVEPSPFSLSHTNSRMCLVIHIYRMINDFVLLEAGMHARAIYIYLYNVYIILYYTAPISIYTLHITHSLLSLFYHSTCLYQIGTVRWSLGGSVNSQ